MKYMDNKGSEITLDEALDLAKMEGACPYAMDYIRNHPDTWFYHGSAPDWCRWYAEYVICGPWPEAEHVIMRDPWTAEWYAEYIIGGRWYDAEHVIMGDPRAAERYAVFLMI